MSTDLVVPGQASKYSSTEVSKNIAQARKFLPQIRVMGSMVTAVKEGKFPHIGHFALVENAGQKFTDYGVAFTALIISWRPKAICYRPFLQSYDPNSENYKTILAGSQQGGQNNPNNVGPEFLLWIVEYQTFAEFYHGNASLCNEGAIGLDVFKRQTDEKKWIPVKFSIDLAKKKSTGQSWHTSRISLHDGVIPGDKFPAADELSAVSGRFNNPKENTDEKIDTPPANADAGGDGRVR